MSQFPVAGFPDGTPMSQLPYVLPALDTRRGRRAQLEVDAALALSEPNPPVRTKFAPETNWGVVFSDESGANQGPWGRH